MKLGVVDCLAVLCLGRIDFFIQLMCISIISRTLCFCVLEGSLGGFDLKLKLG